MSKAKIQDISSELLKRPSVYVMAVGDAHKVGLSIRVSERLGEISRLYPNQEVAFVFASPVIMGLAEVAEKAAHKTLSEYHIE